MNLLPVADSLMSMKVVFFYLTSLETDVTNTPLTVNQSRFITGYGYRCSSAPGSIEAN